MTDRKRRIISDDELVELIRYAILSRDDFDLSDEFSIAIYSTWYLMNPLSRKGRDSIGSVPPYNVPSGNTKPQNMIRFTAHAHHAEPQIASPDDLIVYSMSNDDTKNFITDRFSCKKIL